VPPEKKIGQSDASAVIPADRAGLIPPVKAASILLPSLLSRRHGWVDERVTPNC
jgi:hypothetical protein